MYPTNILAFGDFIVWSGDLHACAETNQTRLAISWSAREKPRELRIIVKIVSDTFYPLDLYSTLPISGFLTLYFTRVRFFFRIFYRKTFKR